MTITQQMNARRSERAEGMANLRAELKRFERELIRWRGWGFYVPPGSKCLKK